MGFYSFFGVTTPFDPDCTFVSSNVIKPRTLGLLRLAVAIYTFVAILFIIIYDGVKLHVLDSYFSYFTNLCYIGLCSYFWASSVQTLAFASRLRQHVQGTYPLQRWPKFLQLLHVFLNCTVYVFPFIVTIVYWTLLSDGSFDTTFDTWKNISVHALNSVIALTEILLSRVVPRWSNAPILVIVLACYLGVAYITHATQGFYTYSFLDPQKEGGKLAAYIVGIPIAALIILAVVKGVCWARDRFLSSPDDARYKRADVEEGTVLQEKA